MPKILKKKKKSSRQPHFCRHVLFIGYSETRKTSNTQKIIIRLPLFFFSFHLFKVAELPGFLAVRVNVTGTHEACSQHLYDVGVLEPREDVYFRLEVFPRHLRLRAIVSWHLENKNRERNRQENDIFRTRMGVTNEGFAHQRAF